MRIEAGGVPRPNQRVNRAVGLGAFLRGSGGRIVVTERTGPAAEPFERTGALASPSAADFAAYLEPGVRRLVLTLLTAWDCLTYSSCEGHPSAGPHSPAPCEVAILPRSDAELDRLERLGQALAGAVTSERVELLCERGVLESPAGTHPVLHLIFWPRAPHSWPDYFDGLDAAVETAVQATAVMTVTR